MNSMLLPMKGQKCSKVGWEKRHFYFSWSLFDHFLCPDLGCNSNFWTPLSMSQLICFLLEALHFCAIGQLVKFICHSTWQQNSSALEKCFLCSCNRTLSLSDDSPAHDVSCTLIHNIGLLHKLGINFSCKFITLPSILYILCQKSGCFGCCQVFSLIPDIMLIW